MMVFFHYSVLLCNKYHSLCLSIIQGTARRAFPRNFNLFLFIFIIFSFSFCIVVSSFFGKPALIRSGKTDPFQFKGVFKRAVCAYKKEGFASSFLLLGIGFLEALKKAKLSFKRPSPKPHLNRTGSVFALPNLRPQNRHLSS